MRKNYKEVEYNGNIIHVSNLVPVKGYPFYNSKYDTISTCTDRDIISYKSWRNEDYVCGQVINTIPTKGEKYLHPEDESSVSGTIESILDDMLELTSDPYDTREYICSTSKRNATEEILNYLKSKNLLKL